MIHSYDTSNCSDERRALVEWMRSKGWKVYRQSKNRVEIEIPSGDWYGSVSRRSMPISQLNGRNIALLAAEYDDGFFDQFHEHFKAYSGLKYA